MLGKKGMDGWFFIPMQIHNALQQAFLNTLKICMHLLMFLFFPSGTQ